MLIIQLNLAIDDCIEASRLALNHPNDRLALFGSLNGLEECKGLNVAEIACLLRTALYDESQANSFTLQYWHARRLKIEWIAKVASAMLHYQNLPLIIRPTVTALVKAAQLTGSY